MSVLSAARGVGLVIVLAIACLGTTPPATAQTAGAPATAAPTDGRIVLPDDVTPVHYDIVVVPLAADLTFKGAVRIDVIVNRPTDKIVLNAADLVIDGAKLSGERGAPTVSLDSAVETATFSFDQPLKVGRHRLTISYHGKIYQQASGLFALDYDSPVGAQRALFTQFENSDARRFIPSWDEPNRKATFTLTAAIPEGQMAVSNMPVTSTSQLARGVQLVRFAQTPRMSSYLLFFGVGDFERAHRYVDGVDVGVIVKRGDLANATYALDAASQILPYYNQYFGKPYPLPKLDLIAGPGSSRFFGAMENWGAIFSFERGMLVDPRISTQRDRQEVYVTTAHEMAHQWFGDLVTMDWWNDLWLNEGFASWMENKVTDHFHPEWKVWTQTLAAREAAMQTDARDGAHPIITTIDNVQQADGAFDEITYQKGSSVIRMLEGYVGEDAFRDGVRSYIAKHAYGNTVTDDLWREIDPASPGRPVSDIAHDFTLRAGVPLVSEKQVTCQDGRTAVQLDQGRFGDDASMRAPATWHVPVTAALLGGGSARAIVTAPTSGEMSLEGCGPLVLNPGQTGYYRSAYSTGGLAALTQHFNDLAPDDQLGLLNDTRALAYAGEQPMAAFLNLTRQIGPKSDPLVWARLASDLVMLDRLYDGLPGREAFRAYARGVLAPALTRIGWDPQAGEGDNVSLMRASVQVALGELDDPAVIAEAHLRFDALVHATAAVPSTTRSTVLMSVAQHASAADWEELHHLAKDAAGELERYEFYTLLGQTEDAGLAQQALDLAISGEPPPTTAPAIIAAVSVRHPALALAFTTTHWDKVSALIEPNARALFAPQLTGSAADPALAAQLTAFAEHNITPDARAETRKALASIAFRAQIRQARLPEADRWLAKPG